MHLILRSPTRCSGPKTPTSRPKTRPYGKSETTTVGSEGLHLPSLLRKIRLEFSECSVGPSFFGSKRTLKKLFYMGQEGPGKYES